MSIINRTNFRGDRFHLISSSPWSICCSICLLCLISTGVLYMHGFSNEDILVSLAFINLIWIMTLLFINTFGKRYVSGSFVLHFIFFIIMIIITTEVYVYNISLVYDMMQKLSPSFIKEQYLVEIDFEYIKTIHKNHISYIKSPMSILKVMANLSWSDMEYFVKQFSVSFNGCYNYMGDQSITGANDLLNFCQTNSEDSGNLIPSASQGGNNNSNPDAEVQRGTIDNNQDPRNGQFLSSPELPVLPNHEALSPSDIIKENILIFVAKIRLDMASDITESGLEQAQTNYNTKISHMNNATEQYRDAVKREGGQEDRVRDLLYYRDLPIMKNNISEWVAVYGQIPTKTSYVDINSNAQSPHFTWPSLYAKSTCDDSSQVPIVPSNKSNSPKLELDLSNKAQSVLSNKELYQSNKTESSSADKKD